jgi:hypothetical protein
MNFACVYRVETRGLAAVKALGIPSKLARLGRSQT